MEFDKVLFLGIRTLAANDDKVFIGDIVALGEVDAFDEVMIGFGELDSIGIGVVHLLAGGFNRYGFAFRRCPNFESFFGI